MTEGGLLNALATGIGPTIAVAAGAFINWRASKSAADAATAASAAAAAAQAATYVASAQASDAARQLILTAQSSNDRLDKIVKVGDATHQIVNNQRTLMENKIDEQRTALESMRAELVALQTRIDGFEK